MHYHHHEHAHFGVLLLLIVVTALTGVGTFTYHWAELKAFGLAVTSFPIYPWNHGDFSDMEPWNKCVVVVMLMAFSAELLMVLWTIAAIVLLRHNPHSHGLHFLISLFISICLWIGVIVWAADYDRMPNTVPASLSLGWSWGLSLTAAILSLLMLVASAFGFHKARHHHHH
ncbi:hypothetical protein WR25_07751 [Diploscapter pachys]|uniref:MARVEL domain-containing protein n=1 Tax=Diploscapter pachys TaxID=2018661 RepID=A0A2A2KIK3_9BILA|nr:hypothetical protein WR25_07751 [Diploscapter pachys]